MGWDGMGWGGVGWGGGFWVLYSTKFASAAISNIHAQIRHIQIVRWALFSYQIWHFVHESGSLM